MDIKKDFRDFSVKHLGNSGLATDQYMSMYGPTNLTPYIMEERRLNVAQMDVFSRLMMDRIIFLGTGIDDQVANIVTAQLLFLESSDASKDIQIYINSPGGSVYAGLGIYDTMQIIKPDVSTICTGMAASMGAVLLVAGLLNLSSGSGQTVNEVNQKAESQGSPIPLIIGLAGMGAGLVMKISGNSQMKKIKNNSALILKPANEYFVVTNGDGVGIKMKF